jgi:hypothetical protein
MKLHGEEWFDRLRRAVLVGDATTQALDALVDVSRLGIDELAFGYRLGCVNAALAVDISLQRYRAGLAQSDVQIQLALTLRSDLDRAEEVLLAHPLGSAAERSEQLWLYITLALFQARWASHSQADIRHEFAEVIAYWSPSVAGEWFEVEKKPRSFFARGVPSAQEMNENLDRLLRRRRAIYLTPHAQG